MYPIRIFYVISMDLRMTFIGIPHLLSYFCFERAN